MHIWSFDAAVIARYIQDKISPQMAEDYRRTVFANQQSIASKEDLNAFTQKYFQSHGKVMPFVIDPNGLFAAEVRADQTLGERVNLHQTPTIFIVTQKGYTEVTDVTQLYAMLDTAIADNPAPKAAPNPKPPLTISAGIARKAKGPGICSGLSLWTTSKTYFVPVSVHRNAISSA